jgi:hypothetical protein
VAFKTASKSEKLFWLVIRNRFHIVDNLGRKKWKGSKLCQLCNEEESVDHLLFRCHIAVLMWTVVKDGLEWSKRPRSVQDFSENFVTNLGAKGMNVM